MIGVAVLKQKISETPLPLVSPSSSKGYLVEAAMSRHLDIHRSHWRPGTVRHHRDRLVPFLRYLTQQNLDAVSHITVSVWNEYVLLRKESVSETTLCHDGQVVRLFLKECMR